MPFPIFHMHTFDAHSLRKKKLQNLLKKSPNNTSILSRKLIFLPLDHSDLLKNKFPICTHRDILFLLFVHTHTHTHLYLIATYSFLPHPLFVCRHTKRNHGLQNECLHGRIMGKRRELSRGIPSSPRSLARARAAGPPT